MFTHQPIYQQLSDHIREKIERGEFRFGAAIPSERELSEQFSVSRLTVRKALELLVRDDLLVRSPGKGTFVKQPHIVSESAVMQGFGEFLRGRGLALSNKVLHCATRTADYKYSHIFGIETTASIFELVRVRLGDGIPFALEYIYVPQKWVPRFESYDFTVYSLYDVYAENGVAIEDDVSYLEIVTVDNPKAKLLGLSEGTPVYLLSATSHDAAERIIEYSRTYYCGDKITHSAHSDRTPGKETACE